MSENGLQQYTFRDVNDDVARLVLRHINEVFTASTILVGGESVAPVDALPGEYVATWESLSHERRWSRQFYVTLPLEGQIVSLSNIEDVLNMKARGPVRSEVRPSEERKYFHPGEKPIKVLARTHSSKRGASRPKERTAPVFTIGLSVAQLGIHHLNDINKKLRIQIQSYERGVVVSMVPLEFELNTGIQVTLQVAALPPVVASVPIFSGGVMIKFTKQTEKPDFRVSIEPLSLPAKALIAALSGISAAEAVSIAEWAQATRATRDERPDYWFATSAALLMIKTRTLSNEVARSMLELAQLAPGIPDTAVVAAWATAAVGEDPAAVEEEVLQHLITARKTGRVVFSAGQSLAIDLLSSLRSSAISEKVRRVANDELKHWLLIRNHTINSSAFQLWEQPGSQHIKKKAPGHILARGEISDNKLKMHKPPHLYPLTAEPMRMR